MFVATCLICGSCVGTLVSDFRVGRAGTRDSARRGAASPGERRAWTACLVLYTRQVSGCQRTAGDPVWVGPMLWGRRCQWRVLLRGECSGLEGIPLDLSCVVHLSRPLSESAVESDSWVRKDLRPEVLLGTQVPKPPHRSAGEANRT